MFAWLTSRSLPSLERQRGPLPFTWATSGSLPSVQNYRPYIVFSSPMQKYEHLLCFTYFLFMAGYWNLHTSIFFLVICWSYLWTEISVTLSIGNKLYSRHHLYFSLSCETTLLMLSCNHIESAKFIVATYASMLHFTWQRQQILIISFTCFVKCLSQNQSVLKVFKELCLEICILSMTLKLHPVVRFQFWSSDEWWVTQS